MHSSTAPLADKKTHFSISLPLFIWITVSSFLLTLPIHANAVEKVSLQLKWFHQFQFAGYYAALEKGYYREAGLDVSILERNTSITPLESVLSRDINYGISDSSLILHRLNDKPVVVLGAIFQHSPLVLITRKSDGIRGPLELKGKRVMRQQNVDDASLTAMFHSVGIQSKDLVNIPHSFNDNDFFSGEVDAISAYTSNQPYLAKKLGIDIAIIDPINYGVDFYGDMIFTSEKEITEHPERALRFLKASIKGWQYALNNKEEIIYLIKNKYQSTKSLDHLRFEAAEVEKMMVPHLVEIGHLNKARFSRIASIYQQEGIAKKNTTLSGIDYREYLQKQIPTWSLWLLGIVATVLTALGISVVVNRRLTCLVEERNAALQDTHSRLEHYLNVVDKYVLTSTMDTEGIITEVSDAFCEITQFPRKELIGQPYHIFQDYQVITHPNESIWNNITSGKSWHGEIEARTKNNQKLWLDTNIQPHINSQQKISHYTSIHTDVTDKKRIELLSITDKLTGLYNRVKLDSALAFELYRTNRTSDQLSIVLIDIDHFKYINDSYGHLVGDKVLQHIATILKNSVRSLDIVGRWGGEEFLIISPATHLDGGYALASKIRTNIENSNINGIKITASLGVACFNNGELAEEFIKRADDALYSAKNKGRNRVETNQERKIHYINEK